MRTQQLALSRARQTRDMMDNPKDWRAQTWSNLGWHAKIVHRTGCAFIIPNFYSGRILDYTCCISPRASGGHPAELGRPARGETPQAAFEAGLGQVEDYIRALSQVQTDLTGAAMFEEVE